jgi:hypothetical protein
VAEEGGGGGDQRGEALAVAGEGGGVVGEAAQLVAQGLVEVVELAGLAERGPGDEADLLGPQLAELGGEGPDLGLRWRKVGGEGGVQVGGALDGDAGEHGAAAGVGEGALHALADLAEQVVHVARGVGGDDELGPAQHVDLAVLDPLDAQAVEAEDRAALGAGLVAWRPCRLPG